MIIFTNNIVAGPLVVLVFALDLYLLLVAIRCVVRRLAGAGLTRHQAILCAIAETPVQVVHERLTQWRRRSAPTWVAWTLIIVIVMIVRQLLAAIIVSVF